MISLTTGAAAQLGVADIEGNTLELLNASEAGFKSPVAERILEIMPGPVVSKELFLNLIGPAVGASEVDAASKGATVWRPSGVVELVRRPPVACTTARCGADITG
ncbi:MAG: hypothetical protein WCE29_18910 [Mycobacterium sp.]